MWFGNLVTMRWWDDLWLNESFATYICYLAMTEATRFTNAWKVFNADIKRWAYQQDQLPTTHPIAGAAADTEIAFLNFDGITYGKGASVLKQLVKYIGRDAFRDGMRIYFRRHAWGNATLDDFLALPRGGERREPGRVGAAVAAHGVGQHAVDATGRPSATAGSSRHGDPTDGAGRVPDAAPARARGRPSGTRRRGRLTVDSSIAASDRRAAHRHRRGARAAEVPDLVFPNYGDHAYAKVALDAALARLRARAPRPRRRRAAARAAVDVAVGDGARPRAALDRVPGDRPQRSCPTSPTCDILDTVLERAAIALSALRARVDRAWPRRTTGSRPPGRRCVAHRAATARSSGRARPSTSRRRRTTSSAWSQLVDGAGSRRRLRRSTRRCAGRWPSRPSPTACRTPTSCSQREAARDRSDRGRRALLRAEASRPTAEAKAEAWERINGEGYGSFHLTRAAMLGFFWPHQQDAARAVRRPLLRPACATSSRRATTRSRGRTCVASTRPTARIRRCSSARAGCSQQLNGSLPTLSRQLAEAPTSSIARSRCATSPRAAQQPARADA